MAHPMTNQDMLKPSFVAHPLLTRSGMARWTARQPLTGRQNDRYRRRFVWLPISASAELDLKAKRTLPMRQVAGA